MTAGRPRINNERLVHIDVEVSIKEKFDRIQGNTNSQKLNRLIGEYMETTQDKAIKDRQIEYYRRDCRDWEARFAFHRSHPNEPFIYPESIDWAKVNGEEKLIRIPAAHSIVEYRLPKVVEALNQKPLEAVIMAQ
jgi:hypothetical protein